MFGGGKVIRESMGQAIRSTCDLVITKALVLDHWGVIKCDVGIRDGRIVALGKAGNPDISAGIHPDLVIGPSTDVLAGEGRILTAGAVDCHVNLICPQILDEALAAGITTVVGGGGIARTRRRAGPAWWSGPARGGGVTTKLPLPVAPKAAGSGFRRRSLEGSVGQGRAGLSAPGSGGAPPRPQGRAGRDRRPGTTSTQGPSASRSGMSRPRPSH